MQSEFGPSLLRHTVYAQLAPLLNGQHTVEEIVTRLQDQVPATAIRHALELLHRRGYTAEATPSVPSAHAAFWDSLNIHPQDAMQRLQQTSVSVVALGSIDPEPFQSLLSALGVEMNDTGQCRVVLTDDYLREELDACNQEALAQHRPWLLVKPVGVELWLGPLFLPGATGCWACLAHRLQGVRKIDAFLRARTDVAPSTSLPLAALPSTLHTALSLAATETAKWIVRGQNDALAGKIVTFNVLSLDKQTHTLVRRPQCPRCGDPNTCSASQPTTVVLHSHKKVFTSDGGHRSWMPEEALHALVHHISPITGIVGALNALAPWVGEESATPSFVATQNFLHMPREDELTLDSLSVSLRSGAGGKGRSPTQAKVSALSEAIEHYSGTFQGDEFRLRARQQDLDAPAVHPNDCMLYSARQFAQRAQWNAHGSRFTWVPERFDLAQEVDWSMAWSLTTNEPCYIPTAYCYYGYSRQHQTWFARADSNGCAAGRSKEEAILQGFLEVVERDSIALWWYNRLQKPAVDLDSFDEPYFRAVQAYYASLHRDLWVLDVTSDLRIPAFAAISRRNDKQAEDLTLGFGAHFDPRLAIMRALTEVNQWLPVVGSGSPGNDAVYLSQDPDALCWWQSATLENQPYLAADGTTPFKGQGDYISSWSDDLATDVMTCVQLARANELEMFVLDQTRPDTGLAVVKVIVPGLRHFWPRFRPGRLYDVPVRMGWLQTPLTED
ncbi:MAG: TOMM precursor leader peptide-binding protein, partial [Candidatus Binatia bacterium]